ncbi:UNVERIFIED_CONTAM: hypothetical protein NCL1_32442 [Trichonephila clavipes]
MFANKVYKPMEMATQQEKRHDVRSHDVGFPFPASVTYYLEITKRKKVSMMRGERAKKAIDYSEAKNESFAFVIIMNDFNT